MPGSPRPAGTVPRPPRVAEAMLRAALPGDLRGRTMLGDLLQEYEERAASSHRATLWFWYWVQAVELGARYALHRIRNYHAVKQTITNVAWGHAVTKAQKPRKEDAMGNLWTDLRYAIRMVFRTPTLSVVSILTIGLGVGLVTFTFSIVYGAVLREMPVRDAERFIALMGTIPERDVNQMSLPMADFVAFRDQSSSFEGLAAGYQGTVNIAHDEGPPERFDGAFVTANGLEILGVPPLLGRTFSAGEDEPGTEGTVVLGYDVWRNSFNADESIIGDAIRVNGESMTIIGVMPPRFRFPFDQEIWVAYRGAWEGLPRRSGNFFQAYGYLKEGVTLEAALEEVEIIAARLEAEFPDTNEGISARVVPYQESAMPAEITAVLWLMLGATIGVMLIACANVANLLLARAALRSRDVAIRTALGANRFRVIRQLLTEALVLGTLGGVVGLLIAYVSTDLFNIAVADIQKPYWIDMRTDLPALLFTVGATLTAAVLAGTIPALRATKGDISNALNDESRGSSSLRLGRMSGVLVVGELAVSCALLIGAGLMVRSVVNAQQMDLGFDRENLMTARVGLFETEYPTRDDRQLFFRDLYQRLNELPGVRAAALTTSLPSSGGGQWNFAIEGNAYETDRDYPEANGAQISAGYFETMGTSVVAGREFRDSEQFWSSETAADLESVAIVNESFAATFFPDSDPIDQRIRTGLSDSTEPWMRIVGVVPDLYVGANGPGGIGADQVPPEQFYMTIGHFDLRFTSMALRGQGSSDGLADQARTTVTDIDPNLPIYFVMPMTQVLADNTWAFSLFGSLFTIFGAAALFLAAVGLYGVMSFSVAQRRQEMGVRMALGAERRDILRIVFRRVGLQLVIGLTLGVALGWALSGPLRFVMFGVETTDVPVYVVIVITLAATSLIATFFPAHRATRVDPVTALRPD